MSSLQSKMLAAALKYQRMGMSVIPVGKNKRPLVKWERFQNERADEQQIKKWWRQFPDANIGIVTGKISGIVVIDIDIKHGRTAKEFGIYATASARSANGGEHIFFKYPNQRIKSGSAVFGVGVDVRADGGYIIVEPSKLESGGRYEFTIPLEDGIDDLPNDLLEKLTHTDGEKKWQKNLNGAPVGERNDTAASMSGIILTGLDPALHEAVGWESLKAWNQKCENPLDEKELRTVWDSISSLHTSTSATPKTSKADEIINLLRSNDDIFFFKSELDEPFIQFPVGDHKEYYQFKAKKVKWWISKHYLEEKGQSISAEPLNNALNTLQGIAAFGDDQYKLSNRIAKTDDAYYYSLTDSSWRAVMIKDGSWTIVTNPPILFRRYTHQAPQVEPISGGDPWKIFDYINTTNPDNQLLMLVWLGTGLLEGFPKPIIYLYGAQGSAKSSASRILKRVLDPSQLEVSEIPKDQAGLAQKLQHHACIVFDNVSRIKAELSDILCRAVTGSGFPKREHYTDDDDIIYTFRRSIGINGINLDDMKPDLLERSILIQLERVAEDKRISEQELWDRFEEDMPHIMGGLLDVVAKAITIYPTVKMESSPRMADFAKWGYAITEALGLKGEDFLEAYWKNINKQNEQVVEDDILASFIVNLLEKQSSWEGTASELLHEMTEHDDYKKRRDLPGAPNALSRRLNVVKTNLAAVGILVERDETRSPVKITIRKAGEKIENTESTDTPLQQELIDDDF